MRELLQEAAEVLRRGQADEQANLAQRIKDCLAEPEPDAMEIVDKIREDGIFNASQPTMKEPVNTFAFTDSEAAALIESYGRRVPRVFVEEILDEAWNCLTDRPEGNVLQKIAAKYGVKLEDAK